MAVPDAAGTAGAVTFSVPGTHADPNLVNLRATISASEASPGTKLFGNSSIVTQMQTPLPDRANSLLEAIAGWVRL